MTTDIVERLRARATEGGGVTDSLCWQAANEIDRLRREDARPAEHVETVIVMRSRRFTGEPPYVGWKGLGQALREDYAELERLRAEVEALRAGAVKWREVVPMLLDELGAEDYRPGNAPGHCHDVPGVWDGDNGDLAGKPCAWCATWNAALKEHTNGR